MKDNMRNRTSKPPVIAQWLLFFFLNYNHPETMLADFEEIFHDIANRRGQAQAQLWYWAQVLITIPPFINNSFYWSMIMFRSYLKIAMRNLIKQKGYSFINITGLALGMACTIFILLWVQEELSFDGFHANKDSIFRVITAFHEEGEVFNGPQTPAPTALALKSNFPEILQSTTVSSSWITGNSRNIIKYGEKAFYTDALILTDPSFFEIFSFPALKGDFSTALSGPNNVVITNSIAKKCFGSDDPINKTLQVDGNLVTVTGVLKDIPENSHLQFDVILSLSHIKNTDRAFFLNKWDSYGFSTYIQLQDGVNKMEIDKKIDDLIIKNDPYFSSTAAHIFLQPLAKIRLFNVDGSGGLIQYVYIFSTIAVIVLLIACINYMNLATARSVKRAKEISLRKVVGSNRAQIIRQFFSESLLYTFVSFLFSIVVVILFLPQFNELTGKQIDSNFANHGHLFGLVVLVALFTGVIAGCYPALYLSSFKPINILRKSTGVSTNNSLFRKILVVTQFSLSIGLIICMMIVSNQIGFMRNAEIGFEKENVVYLPISSRVENIFDSFKQELVENPSILNVSVKSSSPLRAGPTTGTITWEGKNPDLQIGFHHPMVDHDYFKTLKMEIVAGRNFSKKNQTDLLQAFILNEEAVKQGGIENPVGKQITVNGANGTIVGVVKNAQLNSLRNTVRPEIYHLSRTFREQFQTLFIKIVSGGDNSQFNNISSSLAHIENAWKKFLPDSPFQFSFLDAAIENQYRSEIRISSILNCFTFLAVFLSCLGLFGLTSFMVEQRTKEIAVRKTLGAPVPKIVFILMNQFLRWILIANIFAWPVAFFVMNDWLQDFANRIDIEIFTFVFACLLTLSIAIATVIYQSLKAATANPIDALRYE